MEGKQGMLVESQGVSEAPPEMSERERIVRAVIEEVRPNLKRDGGDCELVEIDGNKVMVRLAGACIFCKLASATLEGIQARMIERLGEFVRLIPVAGAPKARH
jgi:Fe-S cluster biogenesis protein NfuA